MKEDSAVALALAVFVCWVASIRFLCPCADDRRAGRNRLQIFGAQPNHFVLFAFMGFLLPNRFYAVQSAGVAWEALEYYVQMNPRALNYTGACLSKRGDGVKPRAAGSRPGDDHAPYPPIKRAPSHTLVHSAAEVAINIAGFCAGYCLRRII